MQNRTSSAALLKLAESFEKTAEEKTRPMTQNPTPKRMKEFQSRCIDGERARRTARVCRVLAMMTLHPEPICETKLTKAILLHGLAKNTESNGYYDIREGDRWVSASSISRALQTIHDAKADTPEEIERAQAMEIERALADLKFCSIPGYFPTPPDVAAKMVQAAQIEFFDTILEPSAGDGAILRAIPKIKERIEDSCVCVVEQNHRLADTLEMQFPKIGANRADFLTCNGNLGLFDRILMNPPFERGADVQHIKHALTFLRPGGRLVAICAGGPKQRETLKPLAEDSGGRWEDLPEGSFKSSGTGVSTALLVIEG